MQQICTRDGQSSCRTYGWQLEDKGLAALVYAPSEVNTKLPDGTVVSFTEETDYPFNDVVKFTYKSNASVVFPFAFKNSSWCEQAEIKINGELLYQDQRRADIKDWQEMEKK